MPSPIELLLDPVSLTIIGVYISLYVWEKFFPRKKNLPKIKFATLRGLVSFALLFYLSSYLPLLIDGYLVSFQLIDLSSFPLVAQVLIGLLFYQLALYVWHRAMHKSNFLWKVFHQLHHSAERLDIPSTFYFSPMDMIGFTLLGSLCFALVMGLSPRSVTVIILALNFLSIFQHSNIKTPRWLGYFVQRPEQHAIHHARGVHQYNYSDFPIYDFLLGTFQNPDDYQGENGFYDGGSTRVLDMLMFKDVSTPKQEKKSST
jgi:sterol desaturase/sphingolipid hydroxylase (fatty acid hydroxylase superfamily)